MNETDCFIARWNGNNFQWRLVELLRFESDVRLAQLLSRRSWKLLPTRVKESLLRAWRNAV